MAVRRNKDRFSSSARIESRAACRGWGALAARQARHQTGGCDALLASTRSSDSVARNAKRKLRRGGARDDRRAADVGRRVLTDAPCLELRRPHDEPALILDAPSGREPPPAVQQAAMGPGPVEPRPVPLTWRETSNKKLTARPTRRAAP